ncbi:hypothetical protein BKA70DRAFT_1441557 [Coprinopsis sp. MPI-PUGE-AT-0042]|nr:hypothetical protein BKA70DRAFT_1441557 [Coprinopsis sp. MPI-PUGE-AT-0042]
MSVVLSPAQRSVGPDTGITHSDRPTQVSAEGEDRRSWASQSSQGTMVETALASGRLLTRLSTTKQEADAAPMAERQSCSSQPDPLFIGDISTLLCSSSPQAEKLLAKSPAEIRKIMEQQGLSVMTLHTALELRVVAGLVLSEMSSSRDELFGDGLWITEHLSDLNEEQRSAAVRATCEWDQVYAHEQPRIISKLVSFLKPTADSTRGRQLVRRYSSSQE